jgi:hypothetical protein
LRGWVRGVSRTCEAGEGRRERRMFGESGVPQALVEGRVLPVDEAMAFIKSYCRLKCVRIVIEIAMRSEKSDLNVRIEVRNRMIFQEEG